MAASGVLESYGTTACKSTGFGIIDNLKLVGKNGVVLNRASPSSDMYLLCQQCRARTRASCVLS